MFKRSFLILLVLVISVSCMADVIFDLAQKKVLDSKLVKKDDVSMLTKTEVDILMNTIYAKYGKTFNNMNLNFYFLKQSWYKTSNTYSDTKLNFNDKININSLKSYLRIAKNWRENQVTYNQGSAQIFEEQKEEKVVVAEEPVKEEVVEVKVPESKVEVISATTDNGNDQRLKGFIQLYGGHKMIIPNKIYEPGERIVFTANYPQNMERKIWIGVVPSSIEHGSEDINDRNDLSYVWAYSKKNGKYVLYAPFVPDYYDIRMNKEGENSKELGYFTFKVKPLPGAGTTPKLMLEKKTFRANEEIVLRFVAGDDFEENAWVGIVRSKIKHGSEKENDNHDIAYKHLKMRDAGILYFKAPNSAGRYDFRMHDTDKNGREVTYISFKVVK
jgi:hypothetical protein